MVPTITFFDFCNLQYGGFYLNGFIENAQERGYRFVVSHEQPVELTGMNLREEWLPKYLGMFLIFRYEGDETFLFAIDTSDLNGDVCMGGYVYPLLDASRYYFKVNYNKDAIAGNPKLRPYQNKIVPIPIVFPVAVSQPWRFLPKITPLGGPPWPRSAMERRFKNFVEIPSLEDYRRMRLVPKDIDVFFIAPIRSEVDKPHNVELNNHRKGIVEGLNKYSRYNIMARYVNVDGDTTGLERYTIPRLHLSEYLKLMARSRIGIYVRGTLGCLSFKFGELMAIGSPVVGESILNNRESLYKFDYFDAQFAYDEPEQIVERVVHLLENPSLVDEYHRANSETFEKFLAPRPVVSSILDVLESNPSQ